MHKINTKTNLVNRLRAKLLLSQSLKSDREKHNITIAILEKGAI